MIRRGMKMLELDRYLSFMVRRIRPYLATKYSTDIIRSLQRFYAQCYADDRSPWTVMCDFDGDLRLKIDRSSFIGSSIYWNGYSSLNELYLLGRLLEPHMVFVDVGANQGEFTLYAAKRLPAGKVLAFEPVEERYRHLIENVKMNGLRIYALIMLAYRIMSVNLKCICHRIYGEVIKPSMDWQMKELLACFEAAHAQARHAPQDLRHLTGFFESLD